MDELVTRIEEVVQNVKQFNEDLQNMTDIVSQLSQFKHWYYIPVVNLFGPSKYIGYKEMNTEKYDRGSRKTGTDTEEFLKSWFIKLPKDSERSKELMAQVIDLLSIYDKTINKAAAIHVIKNGIRL
ncbi:hypothetical protein [Paenibacillus contaminans]|uniref:Uncharacterized protein n=1 Tax=Paenibacillus contaminans TaxID=450362 RepID=A0A329MGK7_9BACL|nr:hypothetical protein [Paenibacillus contaminans]RAV17803.1 hypothetical protein DQG23_25665 [Paenibacillus contaminans]